MNRYRWALVGVAALVIAGLAVIAVRDHGKPPGSTAASAELLPAGSRTAAPDFAGISGWLNTRPLNVASLRGKVVLVDFWTFSCVNCVRTIPHLQALYSRYRDRGLVIVGIHSPEFDFEKDRGNVAAAVKRLGVTWPVAMDPDMTTWNAYANNVWPAEYLLDQQGRVSYVALGEGDYAQTEDAVATLLALPSPPAASAPVASDAQTPELYAGSERGHLADGEAYGAQGAAVDFPDRGPPHDRDLISLAGRWEDRGQYLVSRSAGHIRLSFHAQQVLMVAGSDGPDPVAATLTVDGRPVADDQRGTAVGAAGVTITRSDLYPLVIAQDPGHHLLDITVPAGLRLFTFTFG